MRIDLHDSLNLAYKDLEIVMVALNQNIKIHSSLVDTFDQPTLQMAGFKFHIAII